MKTGMLATLASLVILIGGALGGIQVADQRYAPMSEFQDLHWATLRAQLRDLQERISKASGDSKRDLQLDYADLHALFCRRYPDDRLCRESE